MTSKPDKTIGAFFGSTETEMNQFLAGLGDVTFDTESLTFNNYPFDNSFVSANSKIISQDIINICIKSAPPTVNSRHVDPGFLDVDPLLGGAIRVRA